MKKITISRDSGFADKFRAYQVMLDGKSIGEINDGETESFDVPTGRHELRLEIDWCGSNTVVFDLDRNDLAFECGSNLRGLRRYLALIYISFKRKSYIWLKQSD